MEAAETSDPEDPPPEQPEEPDEPEWPTALNGELSGTVYYDTPTDYVALDLETGLVHSLRPADCATASDDGTEFVDRNPEPLSGADNAEEIVIFDRRAAPPRRGSRRPATSMVGPSCRRTIVWLRSPGARSASFTCSGATAARSAITRTYATGTGDRSAVSISRVATRSTCPKATTAPPHRSPRSPEKSPTSSRSVPTARRSRSTSATQTFRTTTSTS